MGDTLKLGRAVEYVQHRPWAIHGAFYSRLMATAQSLDASPDTELLLAYASGMEPGADSPPTYAVQDGVAIIPIQGPIFAGRNPIMQLMAMILGGTSVEAIGDAYDRALADAAVHGIVFKANSPGGDIAGVSDLSSQIHGGHAIKPTMAWADAIMASAAYWIGSAAEGILCSPTTVTGAIGVIYEGCKHEDDETYEIVSKGAPRKALKPTTKEGKAEIQGMVDAIEEVFVGDVARNRGTSEEKVLSDYGQGGVLVGRHAVQAGLVDGIATLQDTVELVKAMRRS